PVLAPAQSGPLPVHAFDSNHLTRLQKRLLSGLADLELRAGPAGVKPNQALRGFGPGLKDACAKNRGSNVRVNQNCAPLSDPDLQRRGQAANEPAIAQDPNAPNHLVARFKDYRGGEGNCATAYNQGGGRSSADHPGPQ